MKRYIVLITIIVISIIAGAQEIIGTGQTVSWNPSNPPPQNAENGIVIMAGATLTITGCSLNIKGTPDPKSIILHKNSKIIIDNSHINSSSYWQGFRFSNTSMQGYDCPGLVKIMNNSVISNAQTVFAVYSGLNGGGVLASGSSFVDNGRIMHMGSYTYTFGNKVCNFVNCDFYNTACLGYSADEFFRYINVKNVNFSGCEFRNICSGVNYAIYAENSKLTISQSTFGNGNPDRRGLFSGFPGTTTVDKYAVEIRNNSSDLTTKIKITNCDFQSSSHNNLNYQNNQNAIFLGGCANPEIYSNNIELKSDGSNNKYGIYLDGCTGFVVEDNEITATAQSGNPTLTYGIVIKNSLNQTNEIYRNRLYNIEYGIQAREKNRGSGNYDKPAQGLKFFCNTFNSFNTAYYMYASDCNNPDPSFGVSQWQQGAIDGAYDSPNFNSLAPRQLSPSSTYDFRNDHITAGTWDIQYMLPSGSLGNYAINYKSSSISLNYDPNSTTQDPHCESRLPCVGPMCPVLADAIPKTSYFQNMTMLKVQLSNLVNNGDHTYLLSLVENVDTRTLSTVYDALMSSVPSHDILTIACANEIFSASMIRDILVENSYGIKSWSVREAIEQRDDQLSQDMMDDIYDAALQLSEYEELMYELDYMNQEYMYVMNRSLDALIGRDSIPMDSVKMYLDSIGDILAYIKLIHIAFEDNDIDGAENLFAILEQIDDDPVELDNYDQLYSNVLYDIYSNHSGDFTQMDETQIDFLYELIETNTYAAAIGKFLLTISGEGYEWIAGSCESNQNSQRKGKAKETLTSKKPNLQLYPNPATDRLYVAITGIEFTSGYIEIIDVTGKLIQKERLFKDVDKINVSLLKPGFYVVKVNVSDRVLTKPLIIGN